MHVHLPKGFHGWREFAKEVGIIVLGVLIALGFEQLVQAWRWREQANNTRQAITNETQLAALWAEERLAVQPCLHARIAHLVAKLNRGPDWTGDPMVLGIPRNPVGGREVETTVPLVYRTPRRPWLSDEWETAKATGVIDHLRRGEARDFEFIFRSVDELRSFQDEEIALAPQVSFLAFDQTIEPQTRVQALVTLARLDYINGLTAQTGQQMLHGPQSRHMLNQPMRIGMRTTKFEAATKRIVVALRERYGGCVANLPTANGS
jgi:hypothetical protein